MEELSPLRDGKLTRSIKLLGEILFLLLNVRAHI